MSTSPLYKSKPAKHQVRTDVIRTDGTKLLASCRCGWTQEIERPQGLKGHGTYLRECLLRAKNAHNAVITESWA